MHTLATFGTAGTFASTSLDQPLVGRLVANTDFLRALLRHGTFEELLLYVGEARDVEVLQATLATAAAGLPPRRVRLANVLDLPRDLARGAVSVLHLSSPTRFFDAVWLRDLHAGPHPVPVTGQIHTLSYPDMMGEWLKGLLQPASSRDAIFCSSTAGREVVRRCFASLAETLEARGLPPCAAPPCGLPVVPLGVDVDALVGGDGPRARHQHGIPSNAFVVLGLARFTEYDKMDLFPLLQAFAALARHGRPDRPPHLLLAGARQGTKTPEMLQVWAKFLGIADRVHLAVDFPGGDKPHLLAAADLFVSPSDNPQETFGLSVVEAMAAGLPVVVSDYDGYKDTVADTPGECVGVRVPTRAPLPLPELSDVAPLLYARPLHLLLGQSLEVDLPALERAFIGLYDDPARCRTLGQAGARRARTRFDWRVVIQAYEGEWHRLAALPTDPRPPLDHHPLRMDYDRVFGHYPTEHLEETRLVCRTAFAEDRFATARHPIYPELGHLMTWEAVRRALDLAATPLPIGDLAARLAAADPDRPAWHARLLVSWLRKHGLLGDA